MHILLIWELPGEGESSPCQLISTLGAAGTSLPMEAHCCPWGHIFPQATPCHERKLLCRWGEMVCEDTVCFISSSRTLLLWCTRSICSIHFIYIFIYIYTYTHTHDKNPIPGTMGCKWVLCMTCWQFHSDDYFDVAGALLRYWFCTSVDRDRYNCLFIVTLIKCNKQA